MIEVDVSHSLAHANVDVGVEGSKRNPTVSVLQKIAVALSSDIEAVCKRIGGE